MLGLLRVQVVKLTFLSYLGVLHCGSVWNTRNLSLKYFERFYG